MLATITCLLGMVATAPPTGIVPLTSLLSTCVDAARLGCEEIRRVQAKRAADSSSLRVSMKDETDARSMLTEADLAAQAAMVSALRATWPDLHIIGEEDGDDSSAAAAAAARNAPELRRDLCASLATDASVALSECVVFIDPLDGTREFVEGRLHAVQSLVGVAVRGRSIGGAVGLPFPSEASDAPAVLFALSDVGSGAVGEPSTPAADAAAARPIVTTGDSKNALLTSARETALAGGGSALIVGGAGYKLRAVFDGRADLAIMHFGTSLWDTCAPEALCRASGGKVTDLFGAPLIHLPSPPSGDLFNSLGVVASRRGSEAAHDALCAAMRASPSALALLEPYTGGGDVAATASAADVARCIDGGPLKVQWLDEMLDGGRGRLRAYAAPESGAFRGMMSDGCRLELSFEQGNEGGDAPPPSTAFYKRVVMGDLVATRLKARTQPTKLARDVRSYAVEAGFLGSRGCEALVAAGAQVPKAYHVQLQPSAAAPIDSRFTSLLSDFSPADGWTQEGVLGEQQLHASLRELARLHAFFWDGSRFYQDAEAAKELEAAVWPAGGYWQPSMQTADQFDALADKYTQHYTAFGATFATAPELAGVDLPSLGARLQRVARKVAAEAHPFDAGAAEGGDAAVRLRRFRTLIHGDTKAANLFVRDGGDSGVDVGLIDFQWTGWGLAATQP